MLVKNSAARGPLLVKINSNRRRGVALSVNMHKKGREVTNEFWDSFDPHRLLEAMEGSLAHLLDIVR